MARTTMFLLCLLLFIPGALIAQQGIITGTVVDENTGDPLPGANIILLGTQYGSATNPDGVFSIERIPPGVYTLEARFVGYRAVRQEVTVETGITTTLNIQLRQSVLPLDEVVVTGTPGGEQRRAIGHSVTQIRASEVLELTPVPNFQSLIGARTPGVVVSPGTGMVGSGSKIRVRGVSSLSLSNAPLIYVDGIRVDNAQSTGPAVQAFGSNVISRWNDFNPDDIESIEIVKGPSAATLYGTEASGGVIQIITKRGAVGTIPQIGITVRQGVNWFANAEGRMYVNYWRNPQGEVESLNLVKAENERGTPIFTPGHVQNYHMNISGGADHIRYYFGAEFQDEDGVEPTNSLTRWNLRGNMTIFPRENIDVTVSLGLVTGRTYLSREAGTGGVTWGAYYSTPAHLYIESPPRRGYRSFTSDAYWDIYDDLQDLTRFTGSVQANHRITKVLTHRINFGTDEVREDNQQTQFRNEILSIFSPAAVGWKSVTRRDVSVNTLDYSADLSLDINPSLGSRTTFGAQYFRRFWAFASAYGEEFPLHGLNAVSATSGQRDATESYTENITVGVFLQQQFSLNNRMFATVALRADDNSSFGEEFDFAYYPKASFTWVMNEEDWFNLPYLDLFRFRTAYGHTGRQPAAFAAVRVFTAIPGPGGTGAITPSNVGNPELGPERSEEIEAGFDVSLLNERVGLEFSVYRINTTDAILLRPVAPSTGFAGSQFVNIGEIMNEGFDVMLRTRPLSRRDLSIDLNFNFAHNRSEVINLGGEDAIVVSANTGVEHRVGYPVAAYFHHKILSAEVDANNNVIRSSVMVEGEDGNPTRAFNDAGVFIAPRVYRGNTQPKFEGGVSSTLTLWNRVRLYAMVDFQYGHLRYSNTSRVRHGIFRISKERVMPETADPIDLAYYSTFPSHNGGYLHEASFAKLREISLSYIIPSNYARMLGASRASITFSARNLATWTKYPDIEPEVQFLGGDGHDAMDQNMLPQLTQFMTTLNFTF